MSKIVFSLFYCLYFSVYFILFYHYFNETGVFYWLSFFSRFFWVPPYMKGKFKRKVNMPLNFKICYQYLPIEIDYKLYLVIRNFLVKFPGKIIHNKKNIQKCATLKYQTVRKIYTIISVVNKKKRKPSAIHQLTDPL